MPTLKAAAATTEIVADNIMIIAGGILPTTCGAQEAPLRATALLIQGDQPVCIISCDVIALTRDLADEAAHAIAEACQLPFDNILIAATHTHHAPATVTVHGYQRNEEFCRRVVAAAVAAATEARAKIDAAVNEPNSLEAELLYSLGQEHTVGQNSRWHMLDGQIAWTGHSPTQEVRPSGPHDVDLPLIALRRPLGRPAVEETQPLVAALFSHGTHNIGTRDTQVAVRSPGFLGLAAQELEKTQGAPFLFLAGAFGSSHRPERVAAYEAVTRVVNAADEALGRLQPALVGPIACLKRPFTCHHRHFGDAESATNVRRWCERWFDEKTAAIYDRVFTEMRQAMAARAGEPFETWLQVIRLGEVAVVGIPGELFASLGLEIRRRSPFRHTIVVGLANDWVGYLPDRRAYELGGYQTWVGTHSQVEPGTGEAMVEAVLELLAEAAHGPTPQEAVMGPLAPTDALTLQRFYNGLGATDRRFFRPCGWNATYGNMADVCAAAAADKRFDIVLRAGDDIVGWAFLAGLEIDVPHVGISIAQPWRGQGHGRRLMERLIAEARSRGKQGLSLIHVKDNEAAGTLYRKLGFEEIGELTGPDDNDYWEMRLTL